jgi:hypothetical protein
MSAQRNFIVELPDDVRITILSAWIGIQALAKLDSAVCATKARPQFLASIGSQSFVVNEMPSGIYAQHFGWLIKRRIRARHWILDGEQAKSCSPLLVEHMGGPDVCSLHFRFLHEKETFQAFSALAVACSGLQKLKIYSCWHWEKLSMLGAVELIITDCESDGYATYPPFINLQKLQLRNLYGITAMQGIASLLRAAPHITDLRLSTLSTCPVTDECLQVLTRRAAGLKILELDIQRQGFTPATAISLAEQCSNLETLALKCGNYSLDDETVEAFAVNCFKMEGLQLWGTLSAGLLSAVAIHCGSRLRYLMLNMERGATDGLIALAEHCQLLEELDLCNCECPTDDPLVRLVSSLPHLRELVLEDCNVTDKVLTAIATHLPSLATLSLTGRENTFTIAGALALVISLTQLQTFCIGPSGTALFTPALCNRWQETSPGLDVCYGYLGSTQYFRGLNLT